MSEDKPNWHSDNNSSVFHTIFVALMIIGLSVYAGYTTGYEHGNKEVPSLKAELKEEIEYSEGLEKAIVKNNVGFWAVNPETGNIDLMIQGPKNVR